MRHHAGQFGFIVSRLDSSDVDEDRASWQRERVDLFLLNHMKLVGPRILRRDHRFQFLPQLLHVLRNRIGLGQDRHLLVNLGHGLEAELDLLLLGHPGCAGVGQLRTRCSSGPYRNCHHPDQENRKQLFGEA